MAHKEGTEQYLLSAVTSDHSQLAETHYIEPLQSPSMSGASVYTSVNELSPYPYERGPAAANLECKLNGFHSYKEQTVDEEPPGYKRWLFYLSPFFYSITQQLNQNKCNNNDNQLVSVIRIR